MSSEVCNHFLLHTWKKDTCANCLKPKRQHSANAIPQPAKRLSKVTTLKEVTRERDEGASSNQVLRETVEAMESNTAETKHVSDAENKKQSVIGSPKPVPLKSKPLLVSKTEKVKKASDSSEKTTLGKVLPEDAVILNPVPSNVLLQDSSKVDSSRQDTTPLPAETQVEPFDAESDRGVMTAQKMNRMKQRPQITPPQVPNPNKIPGTTKLSDDNDSHKSDFGVKQSSESGRKLTSSHYYQVYDLTAKGLSGKPEPLAIPDQNEVGDAGNRSESKRLRASACRLVEVNEEQQNVAMPYTVVDVTVCPLTKDQVVNKAPPQLPLTPAPNRDNSLLVGLNNTLPCNRPRSTKAADDALKHLAASPKLARKSLLQDSSEAKISDSFSELLSNEIAAGKAVGGISHDGIPGNAVRLQDLAKDLYEDIGGNSLADSHLSSSPSSSITVESSHHSNPKSSSFEARVAALSKLDLVRGASPVMSTSGKIEVARSEGQGVTDKQALTETADSKSTETAVQRQEKGRKSGGKSFFQKFLKRGNKETGAEQQTVNKSSCGNLTIEPILNIPALAPQSTAAEPANKSSTDVDAVASVPLGSSKMSLAKESPQLSPAVSLAKKLTETQEPSEESTNTTDASSEAVDKEKVGNELCSKKLLMIGNGEEDGTSSDTQKLATVKSLPGRTQLPGLILVSEASLALTKEGLSAERDKTKSISPLARLPDPAAVSEDKADGMKEVLTLKMADKDSLIRNSVDNSPTDGSDHAFNTLNSARVRNSKDLKPCKAPRKMVAPPPMAPPPPPPPGSLAAKELDQHGNSLSPKHCGSAAIDVENTSKGISSLALHGTLNTAKRGKLGESGSSAGGFSLMSNTLPRASPSSSSSSAAAVSASSSSNSGESKVSLGVGLRNLNSAAKHARNKTVSEGVCFENVLLVAEEAEEKKLPDDSAMTDLLERRASKFLNRALPAPPPSELLPERDPGLEEIDNLYELVSQSDQKGEKGLSEEQLTYEDIDVCFSRRNNGSSKTSSSSSSQRSTNLLQVANQKQAANCSSLMPSESSATCSSYYLEPVNGKEETEAKGKIQSKDVWRPCPAPRGSHLSKVLPRLETATMPYVNTRMINGQLPLSMSDGFDTMAGLIINMLYHLTDRLYSSYVTRFLKNRSDVIWTDFELLDVVPEVVQEAAFFYQAKHLVLAPSGCILMVMRDGLASGLSLEPTHANVISPLLSFPVSASDLAMLSGSTGETFLGTGNGTVAVLLYSGFTTLDGFWEQEHAKVGNNSSTVQLEQSICYCFVEVLNALLYLKDSGCSLLSLSSDDVIMARFSDARWHPLVKPSIMTFDICSDQDGAFLNDDIVQLLFRMQRTENAKADRTELKTASRTKYSRGLQRIVRILQQKTWEGVETSRNLLEFLLWGPSEDEAKFVAMTDKRETSFRVWLEVARCRMASELVLQTERHNLELASQAKFLCRVTESSLLDVTKLLFE